MRAFQPHLHADGADGQEDGEGLPDLVVQAVLADRVYEDLIHLRGPQLWGLAREPYPPAGGITAGREPGHMF